MFLAFLRTHVFSAIGLFIGPMITIGSFLLHGYALKELGLPIEAWASIGLMIFFASVISILYYFWVGNQAPVSRPLALSRTAAPGPQQLPEIDIESFIERWSNDHFHNSEVSRHTPSWTVVHNAKQDLKKRLREIQEGVRIEIGEGAPFDVVEHRGLHTRNHLIRIGLT